MNPYSFEAQRMLFETTKNHQHRTKTSPCSALVLSQSQSLPLLSFTSTLTLKALPKFFATSAAPLTGDIGAPPKTLSAVPSVTKMKTSGK
jgi:hypothetical protein